MKRLVTLTVILVAALALIGTAQARTHAAGSTATLAITAQTDGTLLVTGTGYAPNGCQSINEITDHGSIFFCEPTNSQGNLSFTFGFVTSGPFTLETIAPGKHGPIVLASASWPG